VSHILELFNNFWYLLQQGQLPEVGRWNYILLAALVAVEGPIATLLGAAAASAGLMRPAVVFCAAVAGNLTADSLWYLAGYTGKIETALHLGKVLGLKRRYVDRLTDAMRHHGVKILFFAKLTAAFMIPSLIAAGLVRLPWKRWFPVLLAGETIWTGLLVLIGYYTTEAIKVVSADVSFVILGISILFLVFIIWEGRRVLGHTEEFEQAVHAGSGSDEKD
jgi:membrane protein DedA with SNARE-associated domain